MTLTGNIRCSMCPAAVDKAIAVTVVILQCCPSTVDDQIAEYVIFSAAADKKAELFDIDQNIAVGSLTGITVIPVNAVGRKAVCTDIAQAVIANHRTVCRPVKTGIDRTGVR